MLLRHGHAEPLHSSKSDKDRKLDDTGIRQIAVIGKKLLAENIIPDMIICSDARRTVQSAEILTESMEIDVEVTTDSGLYTASPDYYIDLIRKIPDLFSSVLIIAHNPGIEETVSLLSGKHTGMGTADLFTALLDVERWQEAGFKRHIVKSEEMILPGR